MPFGSNSKLWIRWCCGFSLFSSSKFFFVSTSITVTGLMLLLIICLHDLLFHPAFDRPQLYQIDFFSSPVRPFVVKYTKKKYSRKANNTRFNERDYEVIRRKVKMEFLQLNQSPLMAFWRFVMICLLSNWGFGN